MMAGPPERRMCASADAASSAQKKLPVVSSGVEAAALGIETDRSEPARRGEHPMSELPRALAREGVVSAGELRDRERSVRNDARHHRALRPAPDRRTAVPHGRSGRARCASAPRALDRPDAGCGRSGCATRPGARGHCRRTFRTRARTALEAPSRSRSALPVRRSPGRLTARRARAGEPALHRVARCAASPRRCAPRAWRARPRGQRPPRGRPAQPPRRHERSDLDREEGEDPDHARDDQHPAGPTRAARSASTRPRGVPLTEDGAWSRAAWFEAAAPRQSSLAASCSVRRRVSGR
jgi:hypothetical protein